MTLGQLIEHNMRNIFLETSYTKCGGETTPRPFSKRAKLSISLDHLSKQSFEHFVFIAYQVVDYRNILILSCRPLAFRPHKAFLKNKKNSGTSLPIFCMIFEEKYLSCCILLPAIISLSVCFYFVRYWAICVL